MRRSPFAALALLLFLNAVTLRGGERETVPTAHSAQIGDGIAGFIPQGYDPQQVPSVALATEPTEQGDVPAGWTLKPEFSLQDGKASASIKTPPGASLYGTGEVTGPLLRNDRSITLWNTDNYRYEKDGGHRLYQSHPWALGVRPNGTAFGVLFDTTWKATLRTASDEIVLASEGKPFRVVVIDRASPQAVMRGLAELTGKMPLPPRWALGFHQCRYSYFPDAKVREIADSFRSHHLPCDVIWLDIHYMNGFRVFTFDPKLFPDPAATDTYLHSQHFRSVWMIDPGVKLDPEYAVYDSGTKEDAWVKTPDGQDFSGKVWPGKCVFPDFTRPQTRAWWAGLYENFLAKGVDGVWNDMNEPSVFGGPDGTMPEDAQHRGGGALPPGPHRMYHNVYGMLMVSATREGMLKAHPEQRPFVLSRSNFLGGQRYAATWTGDNGAEMNYLRTAIPMSLNLGLSGQPLNGPDIGGYSGKTTPEMFGQWIATGVFFPFSRAHTAVNNPPREPWVFGEKIEQVSRTALDRRYRLMPYLYTLAHQASETGEPIMQPVFFADPKDPALRTEETAFLFGPDLLVVPRWAAEPKLPKGIWRDVSLLDGDAEHDGYQPTLRLRGGAIIPLGRVVESTTENSLSPLTLLVCLDESGRAQGSLYEDAGDGTAYQRGEFTMEAFTATREGDSVVVRVEKTGGQTALADRDVFVEVLTPAGVVKGHGPISAGIKIALPPTP